MSIVTLSNALGRFTFVFLIVMMLILSLGMQPIEAAPLEVELRGPGFSSLAYSHRVELGSPYYSFLPWGTWPYTFTMTNPIVTIDPIRPGHKSQFSIKPKAVGTTIVTITDSKGNSAKRELVVYEKGVQPLTLGALPGPSNPVAVGQGRSFGVSGGKAPYTVVSANPGIARIEASSKLFFVWGVSAGTTQIFVTDASGSKVQGNVTVGNTKPLSISAPATMLSNNGIAELHISSGNAPYTVSSSNNLKVTYKGKDSYGREVYIISSGAPGDGSITVRDSKGQTETRKITVQNYVGIVLSERTVDVGQSVRMTVTGGTAPYKVSVNQPDSAIIQDQGGGNYLVTARKAGVVLIAATDKNGQKRDMSLTIRNLPLLTVTAPDMLTVGGNPGTLSFIGGAAPFTVTTSGNQIALTKLEEKKYKITPLSVGSVSITIKDSKGTTVIKKVMVETAMQLTLSVNQNPPPIVRGNVKITPLAQGTLQVKGGTGPYTLKLRDSKGERILREFISSTIDFYFENPGANRVTVIDRKGYVVYRDVTIQAKAPLTPLSIQSPTSATIGQPFDIKISGGTMPYKVVQQGGVPLTIRQAANNMFRCISSAAGSATVRITDNTGQVKIVNISLIPSNKLTVQLSTPTAKRGQIIQVRLAGGTSPYRLVQQSGNPLVIRQVGTNIFQVESNKAGSGVLKAMDGRGQWAIANIQFT